MKCRDSQLYVFLGHIIAVAEQSLYYGRYINIRRKKQFLSKLHHPLNVYVAVIDWRLDIFYRHMEKEGPTRIN
jgi:hypothetical protein